MYDSIGHLKDGLQVTIDDRPYTLCQVTLLHLFDRIFLECVQGLSRSAGKTARCSAKGCEKLAVQAILGHLGRGDSGKRLAIK